jgi:hypothetical protein
MKTLLVLAGLGQLLLAVTSLALPSLLGWREQTARLGDFTRRVFWTYAGYILGTNLFLGGVSMALAEELLARGPLARAFAGYVAAYWGARLVIQLVAYRPVAPRGPWFLAADWTVTAVFAAWTALYGFVALGPAA